MQLVITQWEKQKENFAKIVWKYGHENPGCGINTFDTFFPDNCCFSLGNSKCTKVSAISEESEHHCHRKRTKSNYKQKQLIYCK